MESRDLLVIGVTIERVYVLSPKTRLFFGGAGLNRAINIICGEADELDEAVDNET